MGKTIGEWLGGQLNLQIVAGIDKYLVARN